MEWSIQATKCSLYKLYSPSSLSNQRIGIDHSRKYHNTIMLFVYHPKTLHKQCLQFLLGVKMAQRETENNTYAKFRGDKQRALWYVMVFSGVVNCNAVVSGSF